MFFSMAATALVFFADDILRSCSCFQVNANTYIKPDLYFKDKPLDLCKAIDRGDSAEIEKLVRAGVNINTKGKLDVTPIFYSILGKNRDPKVFEFLLKQGADPNIPIAFGNSTIYFFCNGVLNPITNNVSTVYLAASLPTQDFFDIVLRYKANPNKVKGSNSSPLFAIISNYNISQLKRIDMLKTLIISGADINSTEGEEEFTTVQIACISSYQIAVFLIENGANPLMCDNRGFSPIHILSNTIDGDSDPYYREILIVLNQLGDTIEEAKQDIRRKSSIVNEDFTIRMTRVKERSKNLPLISIKKK
jgi:uncharacterized protein